MENISLWDMREIRLSWFKQNYFILISFNVIYSEANISKDFCYEALELSWIKRKEDEHGKLPYEVIWWYIREVLYYKLSSHG